jgi:hypothetical protein
MTTSNLQTKATPPINNFNGGELSPLLEARFDVNKYYNGCRTMQNALPLVEGGAKKMPGTYYVVPSGTVNGKSRLAPFTFSTDQAYILEFSDQTLRIFAGDGIVVGPSVYTAYDPDTEYQSGDVVTVGNYSYQTVATGKTLYFAQPYTDNSTDVNIWTVLLNTSDSLSVSIAGQEPFAGVRILLANATGSKNAASAIQAAIRALGSVNGHDLSQYVVIGNAAYTAAPPITATGGIAYVWTAAGIYEALQINQYSYFPPIETAYWTTTITAAASWTAIQVVTPYLEADLFDLDVSTRSADVLYIFHHSYPPKKLSRRSNILWTLDNLECTGTPDVSETGYNRIARIIKFITNANPAVVSCADHGFVTGDVVYINHVLGMLEINQGRFTVTYIDKDNFSIGVDSTNYSEYIESGGWAVKLVDLFQTPGEYPACGTFFEQRLMLGGFDNHPERVCGSVAGDFENFTSDPELDDYAIQFDLVSSKVDPIRWMVAQRKLALGTVGGIWLLSGAAGLPLTQTSVDAKMEINIGAGGVAPQIVNDSIIWMTRVSRIVRLLLYEWGSDKWTAPDLTRVARHITMGPTAVESGILQTAYQKDPYPILWAIRADGQLLGMTYETQEQVYAWFRIVTDGKFESVAVVPRPNDEDRVWVVVNRE